MLLGEVVAVGAAAATYFGGTRSSSVSIFIVGAAADVALSKLPAKAPEKTVVQAEGSESQRVRRRQSERKRKRR
jgi:hypothetical protein